MPVEGVTWEADGHTKAKLKILRGYLDAWIPIMSRQSKKNNGPSPIYVDAFAGPGRYKNDVQGSPLVAVEAAADFPHRLPNPVRMFFIESDVDRHTRLCKELEQFPAKDSSHLKIEDVMNCECHNGVSEIINKELSARGGFGPALVFLDQFGYASAPMELIQKILSYPSCEALTYIEYPRLNQFLTDPNKEQAYNRAFGSEEWKQARDLEDTSERRRFIERLYLQALNEAGAEYTWHFQMRGHKNELLYWLFFSTSSEEGLIQMKRSMFKLDLTGNFRFSDRDVHQLNLLSELFDDEWLASHLYEEFEGRRLRLGQIKHYVLTETPRFRYKKVLRALEAQDKLFVPNPPADRKGRSFTMPDSVEVEFTPKQTELFLFS